jgi:two-component system nitrogen regulation response regulator GlnG
VKEGAFREDLYHRLNVIRLRLPALRERKEDVSMLTRHFLQQSAKQLGVEPKRIADAAVAQLGNFGFPGNVRQLENICHWLTVMAPAQVIEAKDLPPEVAMVPVATSAARVTSADVGKAEPGTANADLPDAHGAEETGGSMGAVPVVAALAAGSWEGGLEAEAMELLATGRHDVWDALTRRFESKLILTALANTKGRRIEAAQKLGIGRNTITRKIQELGLE